MQKESKEKLVEKNIRWQEEYTDKTQFLKEQFEDVVGPGSYFRFEGKAPNNDAYYCIIGPAKVHAPRAKFFAGVRKLPATYSAGGKYFDSLDSAARYAKETWGVPTPASLKPYTSRQLAGISKRVSDWKAEREKEDEKKDEKGKDVEAFNIDVILREAINDIESLNPGVIFKEAMPIPKDIRTGYIWHTYEAIVNHEVGDFEDLIKENPSFKGVLKEIMDEKRKRYSIYSRKYGFGPDKMKEIFRIYIGYSRNHGLYALYIGPYLMNPQDFLRLYTDLSIMGLIPSVDLSKDLDRNVIDQVLNLKFSPAGKTKSQQDAEIKVIKGLKRLVGLYFADFSGKFQIFQMPYPVPSKFRGGADINEPRGKSKKSILQEYGLDVFSGLGEQDRETQVQIIQETNSPVVQEFGLDDFSYIFNFRGGYQINATDGGPKFFKKEKGKPKTLDGREMKYSPQLPANYRDDPLCQIYSFSNYDEAKSKNMLISASGTRMFLNRNGSDKLILNWIGSHPEYTEKLLEHMRSLPNVKLYTTIVGHVTKDISSFLYYLIGIGHMDEEGKKAVDEAFNKTTHGSGGTINGSLNRDHYIYKKRPGREDQINASCGLSKFEGLYGEIINFYDKAIREDKVATIFSGTDFIDEELAKKLARYGFKNLNDLKTRLQKEPLPKIPGVDGSTILYLKQHFDSIGDEMPSVSQEATAIARELQGKEDQFKDLSKLRRSGNAFRVPRIALTNSSLSVSSKAKKEMRLVSEIANFMAKQNMSVVNNESAELVAEYLNSGGDPNPIWHQRHKDLGGKKTILREIGRRKNHLAGEEGNETRKIYFTKENIKPIMAKVLSRKILSDVMTFIKNNSITNIYPESLNNVVEFLINQGHKDYFTPENVKGIMSDALYKIEIGKEIHGGTDIASISVDITDKVLKLEEIYDNEKGNRDFIRGLSEINEDSAEELDTGMLNLYANENTGELESFDLHSSFHEAFSQAREITESMAFLAMEKKDRLIDPVTGAQLPSEAFRVPPVFINDPKDNMRSGELEQIFKSKSDAEKLLYRTKRNDIGMAKMMTEDFSEENMKILNKKEYDYQLNISKEINEEMNSQVADDLPVDDIYFDEDGDEIEDLDDETPEEEEFTVTVAPETEQIQDPAAMMEQPPEPEVVPIEDLLSDEEEEEDYEDYFGEEEEEGEGVTASKDVINNLIKLSQELDNEGKTAESVELLRLAKRFSGNFRKGK